jgi:aerobic-type carbon monoxide dehydrogenase small subunit (CoxS/CutS family)
MTMEISFTLNGEAMTRRVEPRRLLSDFLREDCGHTGTHVGCEHGVCGACTVLIDGKAARSCLCFAVQVDNRSVTTVEGLRTEDDTLDPLQTEMHRHHALQCGFCTPGFLMSAHALLAENPCPTRAQIVEALAGNLCRCTGYTSIVDAVEAASKRSEVAQ